MKSLTVKHVARAELAHKLTVTQVQARVALPRTLTDELSNLHGKTQIMNSSIWLCCHKLWHTRSKSN